MTWQIDRRFPSYQRRGVRCAIALTLTWALFLISAPSARGGINVWTSNGPAVGRGVSAFAIDPLTTGTLYAGSEGLVFKSTDAGTTWVAANVGMAAGFVRALAIDPSTSSTLYAGTEGAGVIKSTDAGTTWAAANVGMAVDEGVLVSALVIDPLTPSTVYAGTDNGVFKSTNAGATWVAANAESSFRVFALAIDPITPSTLYAGADHGVYKSTDSGTTWESYTILAFEFFLALALDPLTPTTLYAASHSGVYKTTDAGTTWETANAGLPESSTVSALAIDPSAPSTLYASTGFETLAVFKSTDGGATWEATSPMPKDLPPLSGDLVSNSGLAVDPHSPDTLYVGSGGGIFKSTDAGTTWETANAGLGRIGVLRSSHAAGNRNYLRIAVIGANSCSRSRAIGGRGAVGSMKHASATACAH